MIRPTEQTEPDRTLFEIHVIYSATEADIHLVLARNEMDAMSKLGRNWEAPREAKAFKVEKCNKYTAVILGSRRVI